MKGYTEVAGYTAEHDSALCWFGQDMMIKAGSSVLLSVKTAEDQKQWRGPEDGLHPVGAEVEYPSGRGVVMLKPDSSGVLIVLENGEYKRVSACECKPVPTEEDRAVDELADFLNCGPFSRNDQHAREIAEALYKKGYRKQESE